MTASTERVISSDSHMLVLDERVLAHLGVEYHDEYLGLRGAHRRPGRSAADPPVADPTDGGAAGRPGEWDPTERLADMDIDGVDAEVLYTDPTGGFDDTSKRNLRRRPPLAPMAVTLRERALSMPAGLRVKAPGLLHRGPRQHQYCPK